MEHNRKIDTNTRIYRFTKRMYPYVPGDMLNWLTEHGFFTAPASTRYHGSYEGGLFDHSYSVAQTLCELTVANGLKWERLRSPLIVGMFHDLCKIDSYETISSEETTINKGVHYKHNADTLLKGHGDKSVMMLASLMTLTEEEVACIRYHMGAFTNEEEWRDYTRAVNHYSNILWTHHADMIASHVKGV